jgi:hypothetical protein
MGLLCLAAVWVTALLVAAAAFQDLIDLLRLRRRAARALRATVQSGDGEGGAIAEWTLEQRGRALDAPSPAIAFHDRDFRSAVCGGDLRIGERSVRLPAGRGEVWASREARTAAAACADAASFDGAYAQATASVGFQRRVHIALRPGDEVFVLGTVVGDAVLSDTPAPGDELILSAFDPRPTLTRQALAIAAFIPAELAACALATAVALRPPHFGAVSVVGALLCLGFYLGVTPLAVSLRESVRRPSQAYLRNVWRRPSTASA